ncbi:hypothetical protein Hanom_Chr14g01253401 [Helianthus anomalus]
MNMLQNQQLFIVSNQAQVDLNITPNLVYISTNSRSLRYLYLSNFNILPTLISLPPSTTTTPTTTGISHRSQSSGPSLHKTPIILRSLHRIHKRSIRRMHSHKLIRGRLTTSYIRMQYSS